MNLHELIELVNPDQLDDPNVVARMYDRVQTQAPEHNVLFDPRTTRGHHRTSGQHNPFEGLGVLTDLVSKEAELEISFMDKRLYLIEMLQQTIQNTQRKVEQSMVIQESPKDSDSDEAPTGGETPKPLDNNKVPASVHVGMKLFFKVLQSVKRQSKHRGNYRILTRVMSQLPRVLMTLPALALSQGLSLDDDDDARASPTSSSVVKELLETCFQFAATAHAEHLQLPSSLSSSAAAKSSMMMISVHECHRALTTLCLLTIKSGKLEHLLAFIRVLTLDHPVQVAQLGHESTHALDELASAEPVDNTHHALLTTTMSESSKHRRRPGQLWSFGKGDHGKLGHGTCVHASCVDHNCTENYLTPAALASLCDIEIVKIRSLSTHSVAISTSGVLYTWGNGDKHRLGHGSTTKVYLPKRVETLAPVLDIACGLGHTLALLESGQVYAWGNGGNGRLGCGDTSDRTTPCHVVAFDAQRIVGIYAGASHSLAINRQGQVFGFGKNNQGQCGQGHTNDVLVPTPLTQVVMEDHARSTSTISSSSSPHVFAECAGGWEHSLVRTTSGDVYSFGSGYKDSRRPGTPPVLGHGPDNLERQLWPKKIQALDSPVIVSIACGWDHSLAVSADGVLYTWGSGSNGKLGHGCETHVCLPKRVEGQLLGVKVIQAEAGCEHSAAISATGQMFTWGHGDSGRLGHGDTKSSACPALVETFGHQNVQVVGLAVGDKYNLVLVRPLEEGQPREALEGSSSVTEEQAHAPSPVHGRNSPYQCFDYQWILDRLAIIPESPSRSSSALWILAHLIRLASAYYPRSSTSTTAKKKSVGIQTEDLMTPLKYAPFAIDPNVASFEHLTELIQAFGMGTGNCPPQQAAKEAAAADQHPDADVALSAEVVRFAILFTTLRLVKINLFHLLRLEPKLGLEMTSSNSSPKVQVLRHLHTCIMYLSESLIFHSADDFDVDCGFRNGQEMAAAAEVIQNEAAQVLKVGFAAFYPTDAAKRLILRRLIALPTMNHALTAVVAYRLSHDKIVTQLLFHVFPLSSRSDTLLPSQEQPEDSNFSSDDFLHLCLALMNKCTPASMESVTPALIENHRPVLRLLIAIQTQWISLWAMEEATVSSASCSECLLQYIKQLVESAVSLCTEIQQNTLQDPVEALVVTLDGSFVHGLVPLALESLCVVRETHSSFIIELIPILMKLLRILDSINRGYGTESNNNYNEAAPWTIQFEAVVSRVISKYIGIVLNYQCPSSSLAATSLSIWESSGFLNRGLIHDLKIKGNEATEKDMAYAAILNWTLENCNVRESTKNEQHETETNDFILDIFHHKGVTARFSAWMFRQMMLKFFDSSEPKQYDAMYSPYPEAATDEEGESSEALSHLASRFVAVLLWHNELAFEAKQFMQCTPGGFQSEKISPNVADPPLKLMNIWLTAFTLSSRYLNQKQLVRFENCEFLLSLYPSKIQTISSLAEYGSLQALDRKHLAHFKATEQRGEISFQALIDVAEIKTDIEAMHIQSHQRTCLTKIRAMGYRVLDAALQSIGMDVAYGHLLHFIPAKWCFSGSRVTKNDDQQRSPHYLEGIQGCSHESQNNLEQTLRQLYSTLSQLLKQCLDKEHHGEVTGRCSKHLLAAWTVDLDSLFPIIEQTNLIGTLGQFLARTGDLLSSGVMLLSKGPDVNHQHVSPTQLRIVRQMVSIHAPMESFHRYVWYLVHFLTEKLCLHPRRSVEIVSLQNEIQLLFFTELSRCKNELLRCNESYSELAALQIQSKAKPLIYCNPTSFQKGKSFNEVGGEKKACAQTNGFSVSFWIFVQDQDESPGTASFFNAEDTFILFSRKEIENDTNPSPTASPEIRLCRHRQSSASEYCIDFVMAFLVDDESKDSQEAQKWQRESIQSPKSLPVNQWLSVVCTYQNATLQIALQGKLQVEKHIPLAPFFQAHRVVHIASTDPADHGPFNGILDDVFWHEEPLSSEQAMTVALSGTMLIRLKHRYNVDAYTLRLITHLQAILKTRDGVETLSSSRWISLLLGLVKESSNDKHQMLIFQLFEYLLPHLAPENLLTPALSDHYCSTQPTSPTAVAGSGLRAAVLGRGPEGVINYVTRMFQRIWWAPPNGSCTFQRHSFQLLPPIEKTCLLQYPELPIAELHYLLADGRTGQKSSELQQQQRELYHAILQDEITSLFQQLLMEPKWTNAIVQSCTEGLLRCPEVCQPSREFSSTSSPVLRSPSAFIETLQIIPLSIYILGGGIPSIRIGNYVQYGAETITGCPRHILSSPISEHHFDSQELKVDMPSTHQQSQSHEGDPPSYNIAISDVLSVEGKPCRDSPRPEFPFTSAMTPLMSFFLQHVPKLDGHPTSQVIKAKKLTSDEIQHEIKMDYHIAIYAHLRSRMFKSFESIFHSVESVDWICHDHPEFISTLLQFATTNVSSAGTAVLGMDVGIASDLTNVRKLLRLLSSEKNDSNSRGKKGGGVISPVSIDVIQKFAQHLWYRLSLSENQQQIISPWWLGQTTQRLELLSGEADITDDFGVKSSTHFPTIRVSGVELNQQTGVWFYEVVLLSDGLMQIGWATREFNCNAEQGHGVGDHIHSFAYDGYRKKKWNSSSGDYGSRWKAGDVVGCLLDTEERMIWYYLNGHELGCAFTNIDFTCGYFPAASINAGQSVVFNFGGPSRPFLHQPMPKSSRTSNIVIRPISEALTPSSSASSASSSSASAGLALSSSSTAAGMVTLNSPTSGTLMESNFTEELVSDNESAVTPAYAGSTNAASSGVSSAALEVEVEMRRNRLIESLVGMGFPIEWALRCARESTSNLSESAAIAWIIEQMEHEASKLDDSSYPDSFSSMPGFFDSSEILQDTSLEVLTMEDPKQNLKQDDSSLWSPRSRMSAKHPFLLEEIDTLRSSPFGIADTDRTNYADDEENNNTSSGATIEGKRKALISCWMALAESVSNEELVTVYVIAEVALSYLYAQKAMVSFFSTTLELQKLDRPTVFQFSPDDATMLVQLSKTWNVVGKRDEDVFQQSLLHPLCVQNADQMMIEIISTIQEAAQTKTYHTVAWEDHYYDDDPTEKHLPRLQWARQAFQSLSKQNNDYSALCSVSTWSSLVQAIRICPNSTLRYYIFQMLSQILIRLPTVVDVSSEATMNEYFAVLPLGQVLELFSLRHQTETMSLVLPSCYLQSLFEFLFHYQQLQEPSWTRAMPALASEVPLKIEVEEIGATSIVISWSTKDRPSDDAVTPDPMHHHDPQSPEEKKFQIQLSDQKTPPQWSKSFDICVSERCCEGNLVFDQLTPDNKYRLSLQVLSQEKQHQEEDGKDQMLVINDIMTNVKAIFMFSNEAKGDNLELVSGNHPTNDERSTSNTTNPLTVINRVNKKWSAVRATAGYRHGVHTWLLKVDKCVSKNIFVGVVDAFAAVDNYVGSDAHGWGYLANKAVWHNRSKLGSYGELYTEGDVIGVTLDMDAGTLSFSRNGKALGLATEGLAGELYPAVSLYNKDDQVTIVPPGTFDLEDLLSQGAEEGQENHGLGVMMMVAQGGKNKSVEERSSGGARSGEWITAAHELVEIISSMMMESSSSENPSSPKILSIFQKMYREWSEWKHNTLQHCICASDGTTMITVTTSPSACEPFGFYPGDKIYTLQRQEHVLVVGATASWLWVTSEGVGGRVHSWSLKQCRDMQSKPLEFPLSSSSSSSLTDHDHDQTLASFETFMAYQSSSSLALDQELMTLVNTLCEKQQDGGSLQNEQPPQSPPVHHGLLAPWCISSPAFDQAAQNLDNLSSSIEHLSARFGFLKRFNACLVQVLPLLDLSSTIGKQVQDVARGYMFTSVKRARVAQVLYQTLTLTPVGSSPSSSSSGSNDPPELVRVAIHVNSSKSQHVFWLGQVYAQLFRVRPQELRRHYVSRHPFYEQAQERAFHIDFIHHDIIIESSSSKDDDKQDQGSSYRQVLVQLSKDFVSCGILCPSTTDDDLSSSEQSQRRRMVLNHASFSLVDFYSSSSSMNMDEKTRTSLSGVTSFENLGFCLGQILGLALRGKIQLPLRFSRGVWKILVGHGHDTETTSAADMAELMLRNNNSIVMDDADLGFLQRTYEPLRTGLGSIVPLDTLSIYTDLELENLLCIPPELDLGKLVVEVSEDVDVTAIQAFWSVVESFTTKERQMWFQFLECPLDCESFRLEIRGPLEAHEDVAEIEKTYPIVNARSPLGNNNGQQPSSVLHLPPYPSKEIMRKRLLVAISNVQLLMPEQQPPPPVQHGLTSA